MERSRFWKFRNWFFELKRRAGLSADGAWAPLEIPPEFETALHRGDSYAAWLLRNAPRESDLLRLREVEPLLPAHPAIALVLDAQAAGGDRVAATLDSLVAQIYPHWECCVVSGSGGADPAWAARDPRVRSPGTALDAGCAEFVAFIDAGDRLTPDALYEIALAANLEPGAVMIYSDEDEVEADGTLSRPFFKPDWAPDSYLSRPYLGQLTAFRRSAIADAGGISAGAGTAWREDLVLRIAETGAPIRHIARVLYHRAAASPPGTGCPDSAAVVKAIEAALVRRGEPGRVREVAGAHGIFSVRYAIADAARVSIIIPTRDHGDDVDRCLSSIFERTTYRGDFEILLVDNGSTDRASLDTFATWEARDRRVRVVRDPSPFNYSRLNNRAVAQTSGPYLLFLNNDTEVLTDDWIEALVEQAQRPSIGAAGALLLYPDGKVQHAGVVLGIGGVASHGHKAFDADAPGYHGALKATCNYAALTAACLMVRRSAFDEVGGFDEELAVGFNDVDLCLKLLRAGYRNVYLPHVVLMHAESKTRGADATLRKVARGLREQHVMRERWLSLIERDPYYNPNLTRAGEDFSLRLE